MKNALLLGTIVSLMLSGQAQNHIGIDTDKSVVVWTGSNLFKFNKHYGTVKFRSGEVIVENNTIIGGEFALDMNTIINTDGEFNEMLVWHLKNEDFFYVEKHPTSHLKIQSVTYFNEQELNIQANLTIKDITHKVNFNATLEKGRDRFVMKTAFIIDRTRWNIDFGSKSIIDSLKDDTISDAIELEVTLMGKNW